MQLFYKTFWLLAVYVPLGAAGDSTDLTQGFLIAVVLDMIVSPCRLPLAMRTRSRSNHRGTPNQPDAHKDGTSLMRSSRACQLSPFGVPIIACALLVGLSPQKATAQVARIEVHPIETLTLTDQQVLTGAKDGKKVIIAGELRIPRAGADRMPAVVIVHGSGGIGGNYDRWSQELNGVGIATFVIDGFTGRGILSTVEDQEQLGRLTMIYDVYRALALLTAHPRIDRARIALLGGSRGGQIALYASLKRFQRAYGLAGVEFAAYLPLYAPCNTTYIDDIDVSDRPIRLFHGSADDYDPVAPCRAYVERLRGPGRNVELTEYPDAQHVFDNPLFSTTPVWWPQAQTTRRCTLKEEPLGRIIDAETHRPFTYADPCVERGVHVAYNPSAHAAAIHAVKEFLRTTFKLN